MSDLFDVAIVGGGHNGLTAAAYLASAGKRVIVLEKQDVLGGAAVSSQVFEGVDARLSRYSYLVSLLPQRIIRDLKLDVRLQRRRYSSYTPLPGTDRGLLIDHGDPEATAASFASIGASADFAAWGPFYDDTARLARALFPTVCDPLLTRREARAAVADDRLWNAFIERPVGEVIRDTFAGDLVRGVVLTDALIGTFAANLDDTLAANRCFLYHVIGGETGDWDLPIGGMGVVSGELARAARLAGATLVTDAQVTSVTPDGEVRYTTPDGEKRVGAGTILSNVAPWTLAQLVERAEAGTGVTSTSSVQRSTSSTSLDPTKPEGAQLKVNLLLSRLPRLRDGVSPEAAFGGTFHINESWSQLQSAYDMAATGSVPNPLPAEIYCHTLADPSILSPELQASGAHTLTLFALHAPSRLTAGRDELQAAALASLNSVLAEPIEPLLLTDASGRPCIEAKTTHDLEHAIGLPGGNIFHGPLSWPFVEDDAPQATPAERWGVASGWDNILICGAGAQRGGGVSGLGGHNAAMAVLEQG
ncbi:phytoene desaturase family protein [Homoserinimonas sp. A447]